MKYFTIEELTHTNTGLENDPDLSQQLNLRVLVENILDPVRLLLGKPIKVNSGFRSPDVNHAVGGVSSSLHLKGMAADITSSDNRMLFYLIFEDFKFTQLIWEKGDDENPEWVHVSYDPDNLKCEALKFNGHFYTKYNSK